MDAPQVQLAIPHGAANIESEMIPLVPYIHWRKIYREGLRDGTKPDNDKQRLGLFGYRRSTTATTTTASSSTTSTSSLLVEELSAELDLNRDQVKELVDYIHQFNRSATFSDIVQEYFSDRTAVLHVLLDTIREGFASKEELREIAIRTLVDIRKVGSSNDGAKIAGHLKPTRVPLNREWAAQKIKEECILLECLRAKQFPFEADEMEQLMESFVQFPIERSVVLDELPSAALRMKEQVRLERAWLTVLIRGLSDKAIIVHSSQLDKRIPSSMRLFAPLKLCSVYTRIVATKLNSKTPATTKAKSSSSIIEMDQDQKEKALVEALADLLDSTANNADDKKRRANEILMELFNSTLSILLELFSTLTVPQPDLNERAALGDLLGMAAWLVPVKDLDHETRHRFEILCGMAFGPGTDESCGLFWTRGDNLLRRLVLDCLCKDTKHPTFTLLTHVGFGPEAQKALLEYRSHPDIKEEFDWFLKLTSTSELRFDLTSLEQEKSRIMFDLARVSASNVETTEAQVDFMTRFRIRWIVQAAVQFKRFQVDAARSLSNAKEIEEIMIGSLMVLKALANEFPFAIEIIVASELHRGEQVHDIVASDVRNTIISSALVRAFHSERILCELLSLLVVCLERQDADTEHRKRFVRDCSIVASRALRRHRRQSRFDLQSMSDLFDIETSVKALEVAGLTGTLDPEDAEIVVQLLESPASERLARAAQMTLERCDTVMWRKAVSNQRSIVHIFRIMPETSGVLLEKLTTQTQQQVSSQEQEVVERWSILNWLGPDVYPFVRQQINETMISLDPNVYGFLLHLLTISSSTSSEADMTMRCLIDSTTLECLEQVLKKYAVDETEQDQEMICFGRAAEITRLLLDDELFRQYWFSQIKNGEQIFKVILSSLDRLGERLQMLMQSWTETNEKGEDQDDGGLFSDKITLRMNILLKANADFIKMITFELKRNYSNAPIGSQQPLLLKPFEFLLGVFPKPEFVFDIDSVDSYFNAWLEFACAFAQRNAGMEKTAMTNLAVKSLKTLIDWTVNCVSNESFSKFQPCLPSIVDAILFMYHMVCTPQQQSSEDVSVPIDTKYFDQLAFVIKTIWKQPTGNSNNNGNMENMMTKLISCFLLMSRHPSDPNQVESTNKRRLSLLSCACEFSMESFKRNDSSIASKTKIANSLLFLGECCAVGTKLPYSDAIDWILMKETIICCMRALERAEMEEDEQLQRAILNFFSKVSSEESFLSQTCIQWGLMRLLIERPKLVLLESIHLILMLCRSCPNLAMESARAFIRARERDVSKYIRAFSSPNRKITLISLKECEFAVRLVRVLGERKLFQDCWILLRDIDDFFFKPFISGSGAESSSLLGMASWQSPAARISRKRDQSFSSSVTSENSPFQSPFRSPKSPRMFEGGSPRRLSTSSYLPSTPSGTTPRKMVSSTRKAIHFAVERVLLELLLLFSDTTLIDYKKLVVFPLDNRSSTTANLASSTGSSSFKGDSRLNTTESTTPEVGPDVNTLIWCLRWALFSFSQSTNRDLRCRLICMVLFILQEAMDSLPPPKDNATKKAKESVRRFLFDSVVESKADATPAKTSYARLSDIPDKSTKGDADQQKAQPPRGLLDQVEAYVNETDFPFYASSVKSLNAKLRKHFVASTTTSALTSSNGSSVA